MVISDHLGVFIPMDHVIHPLVFLNISDHFTRARINGNLTSTTILCGCLMGTQVHTKVEVFTSFECRVDDDHVNLELLSQRRDQIKECYPDYTVVGFYFVGQEVSGQALSLFHQVAKHEERKLVCLMFDEKQTREEKQFTLYDVDVCSPCFQTSSFSYINRTKLSSKKRILQIH